MLDGAPCIFLQFAVGGSLHDWMHRRKLYAGEDTLVLCRVLDVVLQVSRGLQHLHDYGLVHADVKPANVLVMQAELSADGLIAVQVTDLGGCGTLPSHAMWREEHALC